LASITETHSVYCAVRAETVNIIQIKYSLPVSNIIHRSKEDTQIKLLSIFRRQHNGIQSVRDEENQEITASDHDKNYVLCRKRKK